MKQFKICIILSALIFTVSCRKKDPPAQESNSPEFTASFNYNGADALLEAGNNDYYMYASNYYDSIIGINVFKGELKQSNCNTGCLPALTVLINDMAPSPRGTAMNVNQALFKGQHFYNDLSTEPQSFKASFVPEKPFTSSSTYSWTLDDGQAKTGYNTYSLSLELAAEKKYTLSLSYDDGVGGCASTHTNEFRVGSRLQSNISITRENPLTGLIYSFRSNNTGMPPYSFTWDFGDGSPLSTEATPKHTYAINNAPYRAILRVVDVCGDTSITYYQVPALLEGNCHANFTASFTPVPNPLVKATVTVLLKDASGLVYTTRGFMQPSVSRFEITSDPEDYHELNAVNEKTKKIKAVFNCVLKNGNRTVTLKNGSAVFAVSYK